ncbi:hypothetical protein ACGF7W_29840 [Streptomyces sp. NPDC048219]
MAGLPIGVASAGVDVAGGCRLTCLGLPDCAGGAVGVRLEAEPRRAEEW